MGYRSVITVVVVSGALLLTGCSGPAGPSASPTSTRSATPTPSATPGSSATPGATDGASTPPAPAASAPAAAAQTVEEACVIMNDAITSLSGLDTDENMDMLGTDPAAAQAAIDEASADLTAAAAQVTNADVKPAADAVVASSQSYFDYLIAFSTDPESIDVDAFGDQLTAFSDSIVGVQERCGVTE
ncbi:hypothetical protein WJX64_12225 [Leifsonia sp. YIM 134122]|uniref:Uncharacterized protein n=1 Tax=Leifsonia stereocauli TaxID=3134136 RepID=A0ABU9W5P8_9MICO